MARGSQATQPVRPRGRSAPKGGVARGGALAQGLRSSAPSRFFFAHPDLAAALLFALFVLVYLWPALIGGKLLSPISVLYGVSPWRGLAPPDLLSFSNALLSDVPTADYPWRWLIREMLHEGAFPAWNPYVFGGIPLYSNPQTGLFSLFSLPLWILPLNYGIGAGAALKLWAGGFGTYLLVRQLKLGFMPGLLAGVCFSFSAINITWLTHETLPAVAVMLPWMLWLVERIFQGGRLGCLLGLAAVTAVGLGGGHPGMQVHLLAAAGMYALLRTAFLGRGVAWGERLRPLGLAFGGILLGTLLMGFMLLPEMLSSRETIGTAARSGGRGTLPGTEMPFTAIRTVLFPDWWGRPSGFEGSSAPITELEGGVMVGLNYNERTFYAGAVGLLLALVAVFMRGGWRRKGPFAVLAFLGLAIPLHLPGLYQLVVHLPVFKLVQNQRLHFVWALAVAVLAAFGLQAVLERPRGDRWRLGVGLGAVLLGVVAVVSASSGAGAAVGNTIEHFLTGEDFNSNAVMALTSGVWYLLFAVGVALALLAAWRWPARAGVVGVVVVVLAAADMLHFANRYQPMAPASKSIPPKTGAIDFLQRRRHEGRIVGINGALLNDWGLTYGLHDIRGYDPPQPSERYFRLWQVAERGQLNWTSFALGSLSPEALQVASVLGARYVVTDPGTQLPVEAGSTIAGLRLVYDGEDAQVLENPRAAPRAMVAPRLRVVSGEEEARLAVTDATFAPQSEAVVELGDSAAASGLASGASATGSVSLRGGSGASESVVLRAELDRRGLVVLNDNWAPGWSVRVDGQPREAVRVNDVMRGVVVGAGSHEIEWRYRVPGLRAGVALSLVALLVVLVLAAGLMRRRDRAPA